MWSSCLTQSPQQLEYCSLRGQWSMLTPSVYYWGLLKHGFFSAQQREAVTASKQGYRLEPKVLLEINFLEYSVASIFKILVIPKPASCLSLYQWWSTITERGATAWLLIYQLAPKTGLLKTAHGPFVNCIYSLAVSNGWASCSAKVCVESGDSTDHSDIAATTALLASASFSHHLSLCT